MKMIKTDILNWKNEKVGQVDVPSPVFQASLQKHLLYDVVKWQLACRRRGTHQAKTRAQVRGGGAKPFRQKGTGRARQGSSRSPLLEGGGVIFPPSPRDYSYSINRKQKQKALCVALSYLYKNKCVKVVESIEVKKSKTKELENTLKGVNVKKSLLIDHKIDKKVLRACRNLKNYRYGNCDLVNVYELLKFNYIILTKQSLPLLSKRCGVEIT